MYTCHIDLDLRNLASRARCRVVRCCLASVQELQAAVGIEQLRKLPAMVAQRRTAATRLEQLLEEGGAAELGLQRVADLPQCEGR
jgi:hypothetical protein